MQLAPDPRRYRRIERDGEEYYLDKFLDVLIPAKEVLEECAEKMKGIPVHALSSSIESAPTYAHSRRAAIQDELQGHPYSPPEEGAIQHQDYPQTPDTRWLVFLSVDICGGTALRRSEPAAFERAYDIFIRELGTLVGQFNGLILKTTGDGFIAYIDHPAFTQQCDNAVDLGLSFLVVLHESINPALMTCGLPTLSIRVGADYGEADVRRVTVPATGYSATEIASDALNRAVKIQEGAAENELWIGRTLYELLHVQWLERSEEVDFDLERLGTTSYTVYRVS